MDYKPYQGMFFDLQKQLTTDPVYIQKIENIQRNLQKAAEAKDDEAFRYYQLQLLRACDYNASLLVPYFFPKYPNDKPMTFWSRPHAFSMMAFIPNGSLVIQASRQIGKCVVKETKLNCKVAENEQVMTIEQLFEYAKNSSQESSK